MFHVLILNSRAQESQKAVFEGEAASVILPGVAGEFEVLDFHKPIMSRLKKGRLVVDNDKEFRINGGVVKMEYQKMTALVEL